VDRSGRPERKTEPPAVYCQQRPIVLSLPKDPALDVDPLPMFGCEQRVGAEGNGSVPAPALARALGVHWHYWVFRIFFKIRKFQTARFRPERVLQMCPLCRVTLSVRASPEGFDLCAVNFRLY